MKDEDIYLIGRYLENKHPQDEEVKEFINIIRNSISICITRNGGSSYDYKLDGNIQ